MNTLSQNQQKIKNKTVIVRCNFDVPIKNHQVQDTTRIEDAVNTLKLLISNHNQIILMAHQGRPNGQPNPIFSLKPIITVLEPLLKNKINFINFTTDYKSINQPSSPISLLENLRYWSQEESNDPKFSQALSRLADVYINEAFANCHRKHASMVGIPQHIPGYAGLALETEINHLSSVINKPQRPLVILIGGAKLETKTPLVDAFANKADAILVGGKIVSEIKKTHEPTNSNIHLASLIPNGKDITKSSARTFASYIQTAGTVIWNGTMGLFEDPRYQEGTKIVAQAVNSTKAFTLVGGGDTEAALTILNIEKNIDWISTGGGAMLEFLSKQNLVALKPIS